MSGTEFDFNDKLSFLGEWFDYDSCYHKKFIVSFYPSDNTLDIFDRELNRMYLKRTKMDDLSINDLFVGNKLRIYGRQITLTDYGDCRTQKFIGKTKQSTLAILKPNVVDKLGEIITQILHRKFYISKLRMCKLSRKEALDLFEHKKGDSTLPFVLENIVSGRCVALELVGDAALTRWKEVMGPPDPQEARKTAPDTLIALYGLESPASNGFHGSDTPEDAAKELNFFFPKTPERLPPEAPVVLKNTTCCVIKPHAIKEGKMGYIMSFITDSHFKITAAQLVYLSNANADEFLEVYKGVVSDYHALLLSFLDGPCIALEIAGKNDEMNVHEEFRKFVGPSDPDIARQIRPNTLRANFGCDKYRNAVHCTDLPEDTELELEYMFKVLRN
ncbi:hypothetical protein NQ315_006895 [Exocentrus adspersus]|uniref:DM10 domain-containing protein n=1 Tax=Exocentrus adspersus TaxID=1586481 RepID=A0AAV8WBZ6_9CUCU|nr:hypothetical protein NQ315_006895 [Exocentrus adspersus]